MTDATTVNDDITQLTRCYGVLAVSMPLTFLPIGVTSALGCVGLLVGVIWAYVLKRRPNPSELVANHSRWMVRTFWISSLFCLIAIALAGMTVSSNANNAALVELNTLTQSGNPDPVKVQALLDQFRADNKPLLLWATIGYLLIPVLFLLGRYAKGFTLAKKGKLIPNVKTWGI